MRTLETTPKDATHWSTRSMAAEVGLSQTAVSRIWRAFGLQPHRQRPGSSRAIRCSSTRSATSSASIWPRRSGRWCCAWTRSPRSRRSIAPRRSCRCCRARPERATHDYKRSGTSSLYAALDHRPGKVIGSLHARHRAIEFKQFLQRIDREVPAELDVHLVLDNSSTHKTPAIQRWLAAHPRFVLHFTPTSSSWLNLVERWFAELTTKKLRRGTHRSVRELNADIRAWIATWNDDPRPYVWTKTADQILESIARYCTRILLEGHQRVWPESRARPALRHPVPVSAGATAPRPRPAARSRARAASRAGSCPTRTGRSGRSPPPSSTGRRSGSRPSRPCRSASRRW